MPAASPRGKPLRRQPAAPDLMRRMARLAQVPLALKNARNIPLPRSTFERKINGELTALVVTVVIGK